MVMFSVFQKNKIKWIFCGITIISACLFLVLSLYRQSPVKKIVDYPLNIIAADRESARLYLEHFDRYENSISLDTKIAVEKYLYGFTRLAHGLEFYTGVIRPESYKDSSSGNIQTVEMLIDTRPIPVTYLVSIAKNKSTGKESYSVVCARQSSQISDNTSCIDESGR